MTQHPITDRPASARKRAARIAIAAIACIPLIYGGALIWANQDPTHRLDRVPAAVVDLDQPVAQNGSTIDVGKSVAHDLVHDHENDNFDWTETDASAARAGLKNGTYLATITLPKDMSANAVSLGGDADKATDSQIAITTNDGRNFIVGIAAKTIGLTVAHNASASVARQYLAQIYSGLDQISSQLTTAANGAKAVASGAGGLRSGAAQLASGATALEAGTAGLAAGADNLQSGTAQLASGADQASSGADQLASGLGTAQSGANQVATGTARVAAGTAQLEAQTTAAANGAAQLAAGNAKLATGAKQLSAPLDQVRAATSALPIPPSQLATDASALSSALANYTGGVSQLASTCATLAGQPGDNAAAQQLCADIAQITGANGVNSAAVNKGAQELATGAAQLPRLANGVNQVADAADSLSSGAQQASDGANALASKLKAGEGSAAALNSGAQQTAAGAQQLATKLHTATAGASSLATGTAKLASGADAANAGAAKLASGADSVNSGASTLAAGAGALSSGAGKLASGSGSLASKLVSGAASVPNYDSAQKTHLSNVAAQPVALAQSKLNAVPSYGYGLSPYFLALGAWVGGLSIYMLLRAIPLTAIERGRPGWLAALLGYLRGAWISLAQIALLYLVVTLGIGVHPQHPVGLALFLGLTGVAFTAVNHALMVLFGSRGRFLGLILLVLQVAAAGATYPIQTTPRFFQLIHGILPMTYAVNAIRSLIAGGGAGVGQGIVVMVCWGLVALAISVAVTSARRARRSAILLPDFAV